MTIKEFAEYQGLTNSAIYNAVRRAGHSMKELTDKTGSITSAGLAILSEIYPDAKKPSQETLSERSKKARSKNTAYDEIKARLSEAEKRAERAEERAEKWERLYLELQDKAAQEREENRKALSEAHVLIARAQEANKKPGLLRLFAGRKNKQVDIQGQVE